MSVRATYTHTWIASNAGKPPRSTDYLTPVHFIPRVMRDGDPIAGRRVDAVPSDTHTKCFKVYDEARRILCRVLASWAMDGRHGGLVAVAVAGVLAAGVPDELRAPASRKDKSNVFPYCTGTSEAIRQVLTITCPQRLEGIYCGAIPNQQTKDLRRANERGKGLAHLVDMCIASHQTGWTKSAMLIAATSFPTGADAVVLGHTCDDTDAEAVVQTAANLVASILLTTIDVAIVFAEYYVAGHPAAQTSCPAQLDSQRAAEGPCASSSDDAITLPGALPPRADANGNDGGRDGTPLPVTADALNGGHGASAGPGSSDLTEVPLGKRRSFQEEDVTKAAPALPPRKRARLPYDHPDRVVPLVSLIYRNARIAMYEEGERRGCARKQKAAGRV